MRVPKSWIRTLMGFAILLLCMWPGRVPVKANSGYNTDSICEMNACIYMSQTQTGGVCIFRAGGSGYICGMDPGNICQWDDVQYGSLNCTGYLQNVFPLIRCSGSYPCCQ